MTTKNNDGVEKHPTFCRICEAGCGVIAEICDGKILKVTPNKEHVLSQGYMCIKASGAVETTNDPDRVTQPLKRTGGPGEFQPCSWDEAITDIVARLKAIRKKSGVDAFASYFASGGALNAAAVLWYVAFAEVMQIKWRYSANHEDSAARIAANEQLYGIPNGYAFMPDFWQTQFAIIIGANPYVSHGSLFTEPQIKKALKEIIKRDGRVIVIDPRKTETAKDFEHIGIKAGTDAYFLLGIVKTLLEEDLVDHEFINEYVTGFETLKAALAPVSLEDCASRSGLAAADIRQLAMDFAASDSALIYGRVGTCTQKFGTLNNFLQDTIMILTGNIEKIGGFKRGWSPLPPSDAFSSPSNQNPTRVQKLPDIAGLHPSNALPLDITTPGEGRVRALMTLGCNPMLNSPSAGEKLESALEDLELHFSFDHFITETNRHAHYILPATTMYERDDIPLILLGSMLKPSIWATKAVAEKRGDVREEWRVLQDIAKGMGFGGAYTNPIFRWLAKLGIEIKPMHLVDMAIRLGPAGDRYGLKRGGLNLKKLFNEERNGVRLMDELPTQNLHNVLRTDDKKIHLAAPWLSTELSRLQAHKDDDSYPLRLIGKRELKSFNSFMHNSPTLWPEGRGQTAMIHPDDAAQIGVSEGEDFEITSKSGSIVLPAEISDRVTKGHVVVPHGWGHNGGWKRANSSKGANPNILASTQEEDFDAVTGGSALNGVPVRIAAAR